MHMLLGLTMIVFFPVSCFFVPAALVLYYVVCSVYQLLKDRAAPR